MNWLSEVDDESNEHVNEIRKHLKKFFNDFEPKVDEYFPNPTKVEETATVMINSHCNSLHGYQVEIISLISSEDPENVARHHLGSIHTRLHQLDTTTNVLIRKVSLCGIPMGIGDVYFQIQRYPMSY